MKIGIIGAGACGLLLGTLLNNKIEYTIFNKGKIGRKILASGNGKCNISNLNYDKKSYHNNSLADYIILNNQNDLFDYFNKLKIYTKNDSEGRMYPISESSQSVLNTIIRNITENIIDIEVTDISIMDNKYYINSYGPFDKIVICTGSIAGFKKPYNSTNYLNNLNIKFNPFYPSLVGFKTKLLKEISGVRAKAYVSLIKDNNIIHGEYGEVNFKDDGISGICVMNLSSYYAKLLDKNNCYIKIELIDKEYDDLITVLNPKLYNYIKANNINPLDFKLKINSVYDFEFAQVCKGGVDISELNNNLSLKKDKNIYFGGEIIDIDGVCGGYNLMFAFSCALEIYKDIINEISNK